MNRYLCAIGWKKSFAYQTRIGGCIGMAARCYCSMVFGRLLLSRSFPFSMHAINNNYQIMWRWCARKLCLTTIAYLVNCLSLYISVCYCSCWWVFFLLWSLRTKINHHQVPVSCIRARHLAFLLTHTLSLENPSVCTDTCTAHNLVLSSVAATTTKSPIKIVIRDKNDVGNRNTISRKPAPKSSNEIHK